VTVKERTEEEEELPYERWLASVKWESWGDKAELSMIAGKDAGATNRSAA
jgi:hypothetical protein